MGIPTPARIELSVPIFMTPTMEIMFTGLWTWASILSLLFIAIIAVASLFCLKNERELSEIRQYLEDVKTMVASLEEKLREARRIIRQQKASINKLEKKLCFQREQYLLMFREQFKDISRLMSDRTFSLSCNHSDEIIARRVDHILERVSGGNDGLGELVNSINKHFDNILVHLQDDLPDIPNTDFKMFCYYSIGFPPEQIYLLLGMDSQRNLYLRKKRLSDKIRILNSKYRDWYLLLLDFHSKKKSSAAR